MNVRERSEKKRKAELCELKIRPGNPCAERKKTERLLPDSAPVIGVLSTRALPTAV